MQISERAIKQVIEAIVLEFQRDCADNQDDLKDIYLSHILQTGKLFGIQRLLASTRHQLSIESAIGQLVVIRDSAENRITTQQIASAVEREAFLNSGDLARPSAGAPVLVHDCGPASDSGNRTIRTGQGGTQ